MKFTIEQAVEILSRTPGVLRAQLEALGEHWTHRNYGEDTFTAFDVVGHLIHGELTDWIPRARMILEHGDSKTFEPFDRYAMFDDSEGKTLAQLLDRFEALRKETLQALETLNLTQQDLERKGMHPRLGQVTMENLLAAWVVHDLNHIAQIAKAMAWQYHQEAGPWGEYLSILKPPRPG